MSAAPPAALSTTFLFTRRSGRTRGSNAGGMDMNRERRAIPSFFGRCVLQDRITWVVLLPRPRAITPSLMPSANPPHTLSHTHTCTLTHSHTHTHIYMHTCIHLHHDAASCYKWSEAAGGRGLTADSMIAKRSTRIARWGLIYVLARSSRAHESCSPPPSAGETFATPIQ